MTPRSDQELLLRIDVAAERLAVSRSTLYRMAPRLAAGPAWTDLDFVFPSAVGTPLDGPNVYHEFKKLLAHAGLPSSHRPHDLRHSTATYLLAAGVPARVVMQLLGHSQIGLTLNTYSHVLPTMLEDAAARLESVFPKSMPTG